MSVSIPSSPVASPVSLPLSRRLAHLGDRWLPRLVLSPTVFASLLFIYGFIGFTAYLSPIQTDAEL
jgi:glucose/mannose transport system permease protein